MNRLAFRGLRERKARTLFTLLAVILGVALIAGTFVLTDTISKSFDKLVATAGENVDVKLLSRNTGDSFDAAATATFPAAVEPRVREVDGVLAVAGALRQVSVTVVDDRGKRIGPTSGAPTLAFSSVPERFDPFEYEGRTPRADGEIAVSETAADAGVRIGDRVRVQGTQRIRAYEVVGLTTFGGAGSVGGAAFTVLSFYSYDRLENLVGTDIHGADRVLPDLQAVEAGDEIRLAPEVALLVAQLERGRFLVLRGGVRMGPVASPYDSTWAFVLRDEPPGAARLIVRERYAYSRPWAGLLVEPVELLSFVMSQKMLRGIRDRAERD